ncbi:uncharacterized protein GGS22DRAFT_170091 [Annulohypoxylon maeteangense]|uniref:uncharacterized protein n=1 Tax=Annulohypoxylon maeteangense TaxID=1927788 RepID=UPI0020088FBD|nr:uncharacterized protein GGS22DRAFT_170091 [Annulohypoxylon maeteangense]KAI0882109.1 hypothetical protein GGS22DRAFT_170091 [Annulohypoxylon maeteangense]
MGWLDSLWSSNTTDDPLRSLDPKLREFLEKESPVKYSSAQQKQEAAAAAEARQKQSDKQKEDENAKSEAPTVPPQSQFQDGRYAHIWKTYRPLAEIEAETKSDHEKLMDVLEGYKERKGQIGKAALENCAIEQGDWRKCMTDPSISERLTMCRDQVRKFEKCYMMQTRLLKALGYLSTYNRSPEIEEDIQLHADALYQRFLAQEAEIAAAKAEGRPIPKFTPLIPRLNQPQQKQQQEELSTEQQEMLMERLKKVPEQDRVTEEEAIRAEWRAKAEVASQVEGLWRKQAMDRQQRKERGEETMWDKLSGPFRGTGAVEGEGEGQNKT